MGHLVPDWRGFGDRAQFSERSGDGDANVETTGRGLTLVTPEFQIWLPPVLRGGL
jgi:hypothetical protein